MAPDTLVAAALLHDIGHFTSEFGEYSPHDTIDKLHDAAGAKVLEGFFPSAVTECVRLHVAAKRYLCATDRTYYDKLSEPSQHSLLLQGGPHERDGDRPVPQLGISPRRRSRSTMDDGGKATRVRTMTFDEFRPMLNRLLKQG